jgi:hypothetical protein
MRDNEKRKAIKAALRGSPSALQEYRKSLLPPGAREKLIRLFKNMDASQVTRFSNDYREETPQLVEALNRYHREKIQ